MSKQIKVSSASRLFTLGRAVANASASYVYDKVRNTKDSVEKLQAAREIIRSMGELKGGWMKLGQMLSITDSSILPQEVTTLFKTLQKNSPSLDYDAVEASFLQSLGKKPHEVFTYFEEKAMAAASIGQVHRARLHDGTWVAVKIQYPNIRVAIENDLKNMDKINLLLGLFVDEKPNLEILMEELKRCLIEECDYNLEAYNTDFFRMHISPICSEIKIPRVYQELSTDTVLVTELLEGESFEDTLLYDQATKDRLGAALYESFLYSFFHLRKIHADPQNGNYYFSPSSMVWLDFGAVRSFDREFVEDYCMLQYSVETNDRRLYVKAAMNLRVIQDSDTSDFIDKHFRLVKNVYGPYTATGSYQANYPNALGMIRDFIRDIPLKGRQPPRQELILLDRSNIGLFMKLKAWNPCLDWTGIRDKWREPVLASAKQRYQLQID